MACHLHHTARSSFSFIHKLLIQFFFFTFKGFGGKFGVQSDRMDKSALGFQENPEKVGTNYTKTKPDIGSAKPSNLRAKFENLAKLKEEEDERRAIEQKKAREEKDRIDREQAAKKTVVENSPVNLDTKPVNRKGAIETGRSGGINSTINQFNQAQSPTENVPQPRVHIFSLCCFAFFNFCFVL